MNLKNHIAAFTGAHRYILGPINWFVQAISGNTSNSVAINIQLGDTTTTVVTRVDVQVNLALILEDTIVNARVSGSTLVVAQVNDNILLVTGGPSVTDGLLSYYQANGATSGSIKDAAYEFLLARGAADTSVIDMWTAFLTGVAGITPGTVRDMKAQWWAAGAPLV